MRQPLLIGPHRAKSLIGMIHLLPLPGAPGATASLDQVIERALQDAQALASGGADAVCVENFGDTPFYPRHVPAVTVAAMTAVVVEISRAVDLPLGVNVLRNDAVAAISICAATDAAFIRVNVHTGAMLTDQGWINGAAHETLRLRRQLGITPLILADVLVKHATPPAGLEIEDAARDTWERGHADALIVSGSATGQPTDARAVQRVKSALPQAPVLIGSGLTAANAATLLRHADGAIVGSSIKIDGRAASPVSPDKVRELVDVVAKIRR